MTFEGEQAPKTNPQRFDRILVAVGASPMVAIIGAEKAGVKVMKVVLFQWINKCAPMYSIFLRLVILLVIRCWRIKLLRKARWPQKLLQGKNIFLIPNAFLQLLILIQKSLGWYDGNSSQRAGNYPIKRRISLDGFRSSVIT